MQVYSPNLQINVSLIYRMADMSIPYKHAHLHVSLVPCNMSCHCCTKRSTSENNDLNNKIVYEYNLYAHN